MTSRCRLVASRSTTVALIAAAIIVLVALPARANLYQFQGIVRDLAGRPIAAATVTDGSQSTTTAADGSYALSEITTGTFTLRASRSDTEQVSHTVTVDIPANQTVNFDVPFRISSSLSDSNITTRPAAVTETLTITSYAPWGNPTSSDPSCVSVVDSRTGTTTAATYVSTGAGGASTWTYSLSLAQGSDYGSSTLTSRASDCDSGTLLSSSSTAPYVTDNAAPLITDVYPGNYGNSRFLTLPLVARIRDFGGSGLNSASISFTLEDTTTSSTTSYTGAALTVALSTGWVKTGPVTLTAGRVYRLSVSAADNAGNTTTARQDHQEFGGFLASTAQLASTSATIPSTACSVSSTVDAQGMRTVSCTNVPLQYGASSVQISGNRWGPAVGFVQQTVSLEAATVSTTVAGVPVSQSAYTASDTAWAPKTISQRYVAPKIDTSAQTLAVAAKTLTLSLLTTKVPAAWTGTVSLSMSATTTTVADGSCSDATTTTAFPPCIPDPLDTKFIVLLKPGYDAATVSSDHVSSHAIEVSSLLNGDTKGYQAVMPWPAVAPIRNDSRVALVLRDNFQDVVAWSGTDCATRVTFVRLIAHHVDGARDADVDHSNDDSCTVYPATNGGTADSVSVNAIYSNYLHSSWTWQDPPNIDLAWQRTRMRRSWNNQAPPNGRAWWNNTYGDQHGWTGDGPAWWHTSSPTWTLIEWQCGVSGTPCHQAQANIKGVFHNDFAWCNFISGAQDLTVTTYHETYYQGSARVFFTSTGACPGLTWSTKSKTGDPTPDYGGREYVNIAVPYQSGY